MSPPNMKSPAPLAGGYRATESVKNRTTQDSHEVPGGQLLVARLANATGRLNRLTDDLQTIADWRDDLAARIRRAHIQFELIGLDPIEQDQLEAEAEAFKAVSSALTASFMRAAVADRRAA